MNENLQLRPMCVRDIGSNDSETNHLTLTNMTNPCKNINLITAQLMAKTG